MFHPEDKISLTKIGVAENGEIPSATWEEYALGVENAKSVPIGYEIQGVLLSSIEAGRAVVIYRTHRNGLAVHGVTETSTIINIKLIDNGLILSTLNSIYLMQSSSQERKVFL